MVEPTERHSTERRASSPLPGAAAISPKESQSQDPEVAHLSRGRGEALPLSPALHPAIPRLGRMNAQGGTRRTRPKTRAAKLAPGCRRKDWGFELRVRARHIPLGHHLTSVSSKGVEKRAMVLSPTSVWLRRGSTVLCLPPSLLPLAGVVEAEARG